MSAGVALISSPSLTVSPLEAALKMSPDAAGAVSPEAAAAGRQERRTNSRRLAEQMAKAFLFIMDLPVH